ncbi:hypothetical protein [Stenotrophomonas sp. CFBP8980]|uniref:hypothetical protein n=1 Tax=Stenotrophomonas sp. CFBP8980 TaxID=3096523 RepID=UPI002A69E1B3|nr:hypothetical protein [Stenotrophomonas sp. CFBP8980]MDY1033991.1 hypothetical protein [Stenotrophomonas sp. CFBP8980]
MSAGEQSAADRAVFHLGTTPGARAIGLAAKRFHERMLSSLAGRVIHSRHAVDQANDAETSRSLINNAFFRDFVREDPAISYWGL